MRPLGALVRRGTEQPLRSASAATEQPNSRLAERLTFGGGWQEKTTKMVFWGAMKNPKTIKNKGNMRKIFRSLKKRIFDS